MCGGSPGHVLASVVAVCSVICFFVCVECARRVAYCVCLVCFVYRNVWLVVMQLIYWCLCSLFVPSCVSLYALAVLVVLLGLFGLFDIVA